LELSKASTSGFLYWYADINFLHFAVFLFAVCTGVLVLVSLLTPAQSDEKLAGLCFATAAEGGDGDDARLVSDARWRRRDVVFSLVLVACVVVVWLMFRG
jgi:SSS family solute:Na+ symporter